MTNLSSISALRIIRITTRQPLERNVARESIRGGTANLVLRKIDLQAGKDRRPEDSNIHKLFVRYLARGERPHEGIAGLRGAGEVNRSTI